MSTKVSQSRSWFRRIADAIGGLLASLTLALMPKCPMCLAAYVAASTGLGLSVAAASHLRLALLILSGLALLSLLLRPWRRFTCHA